MLSCDKCGALFQTSTEYDTHCSNTCENEYNIDYNDIITKLMVKQQEHLDSTDRLRNSIKVLNNENNTLKASVKYLQLRVHILQHLLDENNISHNIFNENENGLEIKHDEKLSTYVDNYLRQNKLNLAIQHKDKSKRKKKRKFRKLNKDVIVEEDQKEIEEMIKRKDNERKEFVKKKFKKVKKKDMKKMLERIDELDTTKSIVKDLIAIKETRNQYLSKLSILDYQKLVKKHYIKLLDFLRNKKFSKQRINKNVYKFLSPLDKRLIKSDRYYIEHLTMDDIQKFNISLEYKLHPKKYTVFNIEHVIQPYILQGLTVNSLRKFLNTVMINPYGFPNIIYQSQKEDKDPFKFYVLESINDNDRMWKLENRLYSLSLSISNLLLKNCVIMFRQIYKDIFGDYDYRESYLTECKSEMMNQEGQQLIHTIYQLSQVKSFNKILQNVVLEKASQQSTKNDKYDARSDNSVVKRQFREMTDSIEDFHTQLNKIFDNITVEEVKSFPIPE